MSEIDRLKAALSGIEDALYAAKIAGDPTRVQHLERERIKLRSILVAHNPAYADTITQTQRVQADLVAMNYGFVVQRFHATEAETFVRPAFDVQKPPTVARPRRAVIEEWLKILYNQRLLVLSAPLDLDCEPIARFIAHQFQQVFNKKYPSRIPLQAVEWNYEYPIEHILDKLSDLPDSVIFFRELYPHQIQASVNDLIVELHNNQQFAVILTELPREFWDLSDYPDIWQEINAATLYNEAGLAELLLHYVYINRDDFNHSVIRDQLHVDYPLLNDHSETIRALATALGNPTAVATFSQLLATHNGGLNLKKLLNQANTAKPALQTWFYGRLTERERLLAIGMTLFEGCYDDQFFAAFNAIAAAGWAKRDTSLDFIEYSDLDNLSGFFRFVRYGTKATPRMYGMLTQQRLQILAMAWQTHRRLLLTALPVLLQLVEQSTAPLPTQHILFGSSQRIATLHTAISNTLSDIARIAYKDHTFHEIELMLLDWMTHPHDVVQAVAGRAIARWRVFGEDQRCFDLLETWYVDQDNRFKEYVNYQAQQREVKDDGFMVIQSAIAVVIGYAALIDRPNSVDRDVVDWIYKLLPQQYPLVRSRVKKYIVEQAMALHIRSFSDALQGLGGYADMHESLGVCVARAYQLDRSGTIAMLQQWYLDCRPTSDTDFTAFGKRELMVLAYISMVKHLLNSNISQDTVPFLLDLLDELLKREQHPDIRKAATLVIMNQTNPDFETSQALIQDPVVSNLSTEEYSGVIQNITKAYLQQRQSFVEQGDYVLPLPSGRYPVWRDDSKREITTAEKAMESWLQNSTDTIASKIAIDAEIGFTKELDIAEAEYREAMETRAVEIEIARQEAAQQVKPTLTMQQRMDQAALWFATKNLKYRNSVAHLLAKDDTPELRFTLNRWRKGKDKTKKTIALEYDKAQRVLKNKQRLFITAGLIAFAVLVMVLFVLTKLF